uniref:Uncharacterized protein n=1 Tax=Physcomitrium patens TaxID=3218 RepID=A0A7I4DSV0_PHYPA
MSWNKDGNVESGRPQRAREGSGERHERKERRVVVCRCAGFRPGADSSSMTTSDQQQGVSLRILCVDACAAAQHNEGDRLCTTKCFAEVENPGFWHWTFSLKDKHGGTLTETDRNLERFWSVETNAFYNSTPLKIGHKICGLR